MNADKLDEPAPCRGCAEPAVLELVMGGWDNSVSEKVCAECWQSIVDEGNDELAEIARTAKEE